jgi:hypothetical protein
VQKSLDEIIARSTNFGHLIDYEPLLALDGACAEAWVYDDPETSMLLARRFVDVMARKVAAVLDVDSAAASLYGRIDDLHRAGVLPPWVRQAMHYVRMTGNNVVHGTRHGNVHTALTAVRDCFDLGGWLRNTITGADDVCAYVPPQPPGALLSEIRDGDRQAYHLRTVLDVYQRRLAEEIDHGGAAGPLWIRTAAVARAMGRMAAEKSNGDALRSLCCEVERRSADCLAGFENRLSDYRMAHAQRSSELRDSALRAGRAGHVELHQLAEIARELGERDEGEAVFARLSAEIGAGGARGRGRGTVYGAGVRPERAGSGRA